MPVLAEIFKSISLVKLKWVMLLMRNIHTYDLKPRPVVTSSGAACSGE
jgi:hypothetical protein